MYNIKGKDCCQCIFKKIKSQWKEMLCVTRLSTAYAEWIHVKTFSTSLTSFILLKGFAR